jgi:cytochrome c
MSMPKAFTSALLAALLVAGCATTQEPKTRYGIGTAASATDIRGWDIDISPDGSGLPAGYGNVAQGRVLYGAKCAACHGANGEGGAAARLVGGKGSLANDKPVLTIGSFWPHASTVYDYINRAMPFDKPQSLTPNEVYALTALLLHLNGVIGADAVLDAQSLPKVVMPNHKGFTSPDPRPDIKAARCLQNCN